MKNALYIILLFTCFLANSQQYGDFMYLGAPINGDITLTDGNPVGSIPSLIGSPTVSSTSTSITISWYLTSSSIGQLQYGITTGYGNLSVRENTPLDYHSQTISNLTSNTIYNYRILLGLDSNSNPIYGANLTASTLDSGSGDVTAPLISSINVTNISDTAYTVNFTTDEVAYSRVEYGITNSYGSTTAITTTLSNNHSIRITGRAPSTLQYFRVVVEDASSNTRIGNEQTTTTIATPDNTFVACSGGGGTPYNVTSSAQISNVSNAGFTATITGSFDATGVTFASGQTIIAGGGIISGTNINLNGACITSTESAIFDPSVTFTDIYDSSRLTPESFGGIANDLVDDVASIDALIKNCQYGGLVLNGEYLKNAPSIYTRNGLFDWDLNGGKISTTSSANFRINQFDVDYLYMIYDLSVRIYNGEFDGTETYGRLFWLRGQSSFYFADLVVHNYYSTTNARGVGFRIDLFPQTKGFTIGEFYRNTIDNIKSETDGIANNTNGLSKGIWIDLFETGTSNVYLENNVITNILGDDAECLYIAPKSGTLSMTNNNYFYLKNETYKYAKRRQAKITVSNVEIRDSWFEAPLVAQDFNGQAAVILGVFCTNSGQTNKNFKLINTDLVSQGMHVMNGLSLTEMEDAVITGNRITWSDLSNMAGINVGSGTAGYFGVMKNNIISGNILTNCFLQVSPILAPEGQLVFDNNTYNFTWNGNNPGQNIGVLRYLIYTNTTVSHPITISNSTVNYSSANYFSLWTGMVMSNFASVEGLTIENIIMNYNTPAGTNAVFGRMAANFGSSNIIKNITINGRAGTGALTILGSIKNPQIINSTGTISGTTTPITVQ